MNLAESIRVSLRALAANKLRSALTMLGIVIGVGAVITLMAAGQGVQVYVAERFQGIGTNLLFVIPGTFEAAGPAQAHSVTRPMTMADVRALSDPFRLPDVARLAPELDRSATVVAGGQQMDTQVQGVTPEFAHVRNWYPVVGDFISSQDLEGRTRVAVLGQTVAENLFPDSPYPIGESIRINTIPFRVVGVMEEKGGSFTDQDNVVFVPLTTAQTRLYSARTASGEYRVSFILVEAISEDRMEAAAEQIRMVLREQHKIAFEDEDDFTVLSQSDLIQTFGQITGVLTVFLGAIAGISLLVGGIGIMNIMLVSVTERTREIGIRMAVGAQARQVLMQFLVEAIVLSALGGVLGVALGLGLAAVAAQILNVPFTPDAETIVMAFAFSALVGVVFGYFPAHRAARLDPIEALRH